VAFIHKKALPTPEEIIDKMPLSPYSKEIKEQRASMLKAIIEGESPLFLLIIGPCSADDEDSVLEYTLKLAEMQDRVKDKLFIVPRVYTSKPRTVGLGYMGMLHQPNPVLESDMLAGIEAIRRLHIRCLSETGLTVADEMLYPDNLLYCIDLLGYVAVGARSVENQQHRLVASGIDLPVGFKNPISGALSTMFNAVQTAQMPHTFIFRNNEVQTCGNSLTHAILRGSVNRQGQDMPNYHFEELARAVRLYEDRALRNPAIIVDTNHSNSAKRYDEQPRIAKDVLNSRNHNKAIKKAVRGLMIESYLEEGSQEIASVSYRRGKSITDPCMGWAATETLIYHIAENV